MIGYGVMQIWGILALDALAFMLPPLVAPLDNDNPD
jgi:hypothetical protein